MKRRALLTALLGCPALAWTGLSAKERGDVDLGVREETSLWDDRYASQIADIDGADKCTPQPWEPRRFLISLFRRRGPAVGDMIRFESYNMKIVGIVTEVGHTRGMDWYSGRMIHWERAGRGCVPQNVRQINP